MKVLDKGDVRLIDYMGDDSAVVRSARVSNGIRPYKPDAVKDQRLINYLMKHRHGTPFEHSVFTFYVKAPIFVTREWMRHRIGSYNEVSGRYTEFEPEFYIPQVYRISATSNKQGSVLNPDDKSGDWSWEAEQDVRRITFAAYDVYKLLLQDGVAKEMARMVLPVNLYTEFYWTVNARALMNFLNLRLGADAQFEIREYARAIENEFKGVMPMTWRAWTDNNHLAP